MIFYTIIVWIHNISVILILLYFVNYISILAKINWTKFNDRLTNRMEIFNEFCSSFNILIIIWYTDFILDPEIKFNYGWILVSFLIFNLIIGFSVPIIISIKKMTKVIHILYLGLILVEKQY